MKFEFTMKSIVSLDNQDKFILRPEYTDDDDDVGCTKLC